VCVCVCADFSDIFRSLLGPSSCCLYNSFENKGQKCITNVHVICKASHLQTSVQFFDLGQRVQRQYLDISEHLKGSKTRKVPKG
jgi:hypothetical protein